MWQLFIGSLVLSVVHGLIPNHWIPLIAVGKSEKWSVKDTLFATGVTGFAHTLSTVLLGVVVGFVGYRLSDHFELITSVIAPTILVLMGIVYLILDYRNARHRHHHEHINLEKVKSGKSKFAILSTLSLAMFFSPCLELEAFYFKAGTLGWPGILTVSAVYMIVTILVMLILVYLGMKGVRRIKSHYLENHEKQITGFVLIILGVIAYFLELQHTH